MKGIKFLFAVLAFGLLFTSCSEYSKVLKSNDLNYKFEMAKKYYDKKKYNKAYPIFDELLNLYRGTAQAEEVYYYYSMTLYKLEDYMLAAYHFKNFYRTFPQSKYADEAAFMTGYCYYLESPVYSLDQTYTIKAINELQLYINTHPKSTRIEQCNELIIELRQKLERKNFERAKQYYTTMQYQAAIVALNNVLNDFPETRYREEILLLLLRSNYELARFSIESKKLQRFIETRKACEDFLERYPDSRFAKEASTIRERAMFQIEFLKENQEYGS
ncbi:outer membrane protein assembly factor BamD [Schleiferia thermophila]|jgi:outer membrane protein assembly factor BamD|uniref:Beta-barrel assembly machine subunit BamD n=1 Tax=Schleiferia thermophila TaxID=884107 RepID=A0A369A9R1_9FLAO|nr:outer membrane protein assembly factor BamD [Schleiferia thermophila]KFD39531.1 outer membrane assembly lipoprotein YfiO [Schleiferia thermophila str. Yellowstone]RCX05046.1 Beta-barrel assembly machine subunit BamD [Schleiferia thermophila]GCD79436.1 outer membrane protein assembly factor BamD [Schleiferia thermophila]